MNALPPLIYHTDFLDVIDVDINEKKLNNFLEGLCKSDNDYNAFRSNKNALEKVKIVSKIFSFFIIPAIITLPLYFWSKRKLEVIAAAETWHQVKIEVLNKNWDGAINHLNKFINPEIQQQLNTASTFFDGKSNTFSKNFSSQMDRNGCVEQSYDNFVILTSHLLAYAHFKKTSQELKKQFSCDRVLLSDVQEPIWRNLMKAMYYASRTRGGFSSCPQTSPIAKKFLEATNHFEKNN